MVKVISRPRLEFILSFFLVVTILIAFRELPKHDFVILDDHAYVTENNRVSAGITIKNISWAFKSTDIGYWHPLTWLSHMLDCQLFGMNPGMHHLTGLLFHIVNTLLLFFILKRMTGAIWRSGFVAVLFALHPLNVESVAWVAERKNVLSTFFWMLTLLIYSSYAQQPDIKKYVALMTVFALGLMAKPMLVTLPFVLLLLDYWPLCRLNPVRSSVGGVTGECNGTSSGFEGSLIFRLVLEKIPFLALSAGSIFFSLLSYHQLISYESTPISLRIANALVSYVDYMGKMVWPQKLAVFYPYPEALPTWQAAAAGLLLICISALIIYNMKTKPYLVVGWLWYLGTLVPVIGIVQWGLWPAMADRFVYVPLIGLLIMIAWGGPDLLIRFKYPRILCTISSATVVFALTACTLNQVRHWENSHTLFQNAVNVTPGNYFAHNGLGIAFSQEGKLNEALSHYKKALKIKPDYADAHSNLGLALSEKGKIDAAVLEYKEALKIKPDNIAALFNLGNALGDLGKFDEAVFYYKEALKLKPDFVEAHYNLANTQVHLGNDNEADIHYAEALRIYPRNEKAHYNYGNLLLRQGKPKQAIFHFAEALKQDPYLAEAYDQIGVILARQGKYKKARVFFLKAVQIRPSYTQAHEHLENCKANAVVHK
jgi:tetratricopeptide (TPR) repeat protein